MLQSIPNFLEKDEEGESISCSRCKQVIVIQPNHYNPKVVEALIEEHLSECHTDKSLKN